MDDGELGHFSLLEKIGEGGMGRVYKARDKRLDRFVAIKLLAEARSTDADRRARFVQEAKAASALNHPNIITIHEIGEQDGQTFIVMELVDGKPLNELIPRKGMRITAALGIAAQVADALSAAHAAGIVHRDLKPANIMVDAQGRAKVLDFGLAKLTARAAASAAGADEATRSLAIDQPVSEEGVIFGSVPYMSPEQTEGKPLDARSDIFSFGAVLYEMITGQRAFRGESRASTLAAIVEKEPPPVGEIASTTPPEIERLIARCLRKDVNRRSQNMADVKLALEELRDESESGTLAPPAAAAEVGARRWVWPAVAIACVLIAAAAFARIYLNLRGGTTAAAPVRFRIPFTGRPATGGAFALSPDGRQLAFAAVGPDGIGRLWILALDSLEARPLPGTEFAQEVIPPIFWSPDSRFIAFDAGRRLKKIDISGGVAQTICELPGLAVGGSWNKDGVIIFGNDAPGVGLMRVSAAGGTASPLTKVDRSRNEGLHVLPSFLPDGRHFLYFRNSKTPENSGTYVGSIDAEPGKQESRQLLASVSALYAPSSDSGSGQLLFLRRETLLAQAFDARRLQLTGEPIRVAEQVGNYLAYGFFSLSTNGILAYRTGAQDFQLTWLDRQGSAIGRVWEPGPYTSLALSPDGMRAVISRNDSFPSPWDLWLLDLARGTSKRFTSAAGRNDYPVWSPDGSRVVFASSREVGTNTVLNLYQKLASGAKEEEVLLRSGETMFPTSWSRDGRFLLYAVADPKMKNDIWVLSMDGDHQRTRLLGTEFNESQAQFSPDSRWIAYTSDASGRTEVYVRTFPEAKEDFDFVVSKGGGSSPRWRGDGKELYYISSDGKVMAVEVAAGGLFQPGTPKPLFQVSSVLPEWNVTADGKRFLFAVQIEQTQTPFTVVSNWLAGQKK